MDATGRYVPRSDVDLLMAVAFERAGMRDSSSVYGAYARRAWEHAGPERRRMLTLLDASR